MIVQASKLTSKIHTQTPKDAVLKLSGTITHVSGEKRQLIVSMNEATMEILYLHIIGGINSESDISMAFCLKADAVLELSGTITHISEEKRKLIVLMDEATMEIFHLHKDAINPKSDISMTFSLKTE